MRREQAHQTELEKWEDKHDPRRRTPSGLGIGSVMYDEESTLGGVPMSKRTSSFDTLGGMPMLGKDGRGGRSPVLGREGGGASPILSSPPSSSTHDDPELKEKERLLLEVRLSIIFFASSLQR